MQILHWLFRFIGFSFLLVQDIITLQDCLYLKKVDQYNL
uniref:Uncharacterized protein n=1 Tax=Manihot esculenta TaxID=3983 RepID=A0A2C9VIG5_MANES